MDKLFGPDWRAMELEHAWQKACRRWNFKESDKSGLSNYIRPRSILKLISNTIEQYYYSSNSVVIFSVFSERQGPGGNFHKPLRYAVSVPQPYHHYLPIRAMANQTQTSYLCFREFSSLPNKDPVFRSA